MRIQIFIMLMISSLAFVVVGCGNAKSTDALIGDSISSAEGDRVKAVRLLQNRTGDAPKVVPALIESLKDVQADIRWSAAIGLGYFGAKASPALPALEAAQRDNDARVRNAARVAISRIRG